MTGRSWGSKTWGPRRGEGRISRRAYGSCGRAVGEAADDDEDNPTWTASSKGRIARSVTGPGGRLSALTSGTGDTVLQLSDLHGDVAVQLPLDQAAAPVVQRYDEYGKPLDGPASATYGWLGAAAAGLLPPAVRRAGPDRAYLRTGGRTAHLFRAGHLA
ncbi:hypothetical protein ACIOHB_14420 [Streptomyces microflavus]|uniref:hypothetical protein n=1 Tax=Streptomyces microflavus TaxID=1919 RepID=UPI0037FF1026